MASKFISHELSIKAWIEERPAYKRSFKDGGFIVKFSLESFVYDCDGVVRVVNTNSDSHLLNALKGHVTELLDLGIDCTYLLDPKNYNKIFVPWVYNQTSITTILDNADQEIEEANNQQTLSKAKDRRDCLHSQIILDEETILINEKVISM